MLGDESVSRGHQQRSVLLPETTDGVRERGWRQGDEAGDGRNRTERRRWRMTAFGCGRKADCLDTTTLGEKPFLLSLMNQYVLGEVLLAFMCTFPAQSEVKA